MHTFLESIKHIIVLGKIKSYLTKKNVKINLWIYAQYKKGIDEKNMEYQEMNFKTENEVITKATNLQEFYSRCIIKIVTKMEEFEIRGSQWRLNYISYLQLNVNIIIYRAASCQHLSKIKKPLSM